MSSATVSVIMAAFNAASCVDRAIDSVLAQTHGRWELLVIDDGSSDETAALVRARSQGDARIRLFQQSVNRGPSAARNIGIDHAEGEWIAILDADDAFKPERLERMLAVAEQTGADFIADNLLSYDLSAGRVTGSTYDVPRLRRLALGDFIASEIGKVFALGFIKPLIRTEIIRGKHIRYHEELRYAEDFAFYTDLMLARIDAYIIPDSLYFYTRQVGGASGKASSLSKTRYTPSTRLEIARYLKDKYAAAMTVSEHAMLERYEAWATTYAYAHTMSEHKNAKQYRGMAALMIQQPRAAIRFLLAQKPLRIMFGTGL